MAKIINISDRSDSQLLTEYKSGNDVLGELYLRYSNLVLGSCYKYLKNKEDAEDAVAEIFLLLSQKLKTHEVEHFKSWLFTVTRNHCIEVLRKQNRQKEKITEVEIMYSDQVFHLDDVVDPLVVDKMQKCIDKLPELQSKSVQMFYFDKKGYKVIAEECNISWDKVRSLIQNARRNMKLCMENKMIK